MKTNKHTLFSILFLLIFISAFSVGTYSSLSNSLKEFSHSSFKKELKQDGNTTASENLVFEETENDSEDSLIPEFTLVPSFLDFTFFSSIFHNNLSDFTYSEKATGPIFLSIRSIRI